MSRCHQHDHVRNKSFFSSDSSYHRPPSSVGTISEKGVSSSGDNDATAADVIALDVSVSAADCPSPRECTANLLQLYPSGKMEKPWRYDLSEWEDVMLQNRRWPYQVQEQGLVTLVRGVLSSCLTLKDVMEVAMRHIDSLDKRILTKLRNLIKLQLQAQDLHITVTTTLVDMIQKKGVIVPGNITVLLRMQTRRQLALGELFQQLESVSDHRSCLPESLPLLRSLRDLIKEYFRGALSLGRLEVEDLMFMVRKHSSHRAVEKRIENKVFIMHFDMCCFPVLALLLGSLEPEGRTHKICNLTAAPKAIARVMAILYQRTYQKDFLKPAQALLSKFGDMDRRRPSFAPSISTAWEEHQHSIHKHHAPAAATQQTTFDSNQPSALDYSTNPNTSLKHRRGIVTEPSTTPRQQQARRLFAANKSSSGRFTQ